MKIRENHTQLSVQRNSELQLKQWDEFTANRPALLAMMSLIPDVSRCNGAPLSVRKSQECATIAMKAASFAAQVLSYCIILPYGENQLRSETAIGRDPITISQLELDAGSMPALLL
jgi:hypothetical protein